jgi:hypothetical protein
LDHEKIWKLQIPYTIKKLKCLTRIQVQISKYGGVDIFFDGVKFDVTANLTTLVLTAAQVIIDETAKNVKISFDAGLTVKVDYNNNDALAVETSATPDLLTSGTSL